MNENEKQNAIAVLNKILELELGGRCAIHALQLDGLWLQPHTDRVVAKG